MNSVSLGFMPTRPLNGFALLGWNSAQNSLTYTVDRLTDNGSDGIGEGAGLTGDLRYAITNAQSEDNIIFSVSGEIKLLRALPILTQDISIGGVDGSTVRGSGGSVFFVDSGASIVFSNLTITGGTGNGGGIFNSGTLILNNVTVRGNKAGDPTNGGGTGAGIWNNTNGILTLNNSTVSGNTVLGSSFYNPSRGGGIANYGTLTLNNSTVSGNSASEGSGGGISNTLPTSIMTLNNSTISGNSAVGVIGIGGGIDNHGTLNIINSILASNTKDDFRGVFISQGHNLIGNTTGGSGFRLDLGDLLNVNPLLDSLKNNGGLTQTHALLTGSPAIDQGDNAGCPQTDQRGYSRPVDGDGNDGNGVAVCDIGAYEFDGIPSAATATQNPVESLTPTITPSVASTNTPSPTLTFTQEPVSTTPTPTVPATPTSTPAPPALPCSGAALLLVTIVLLMYSSSKQIYR